MSGRSRSEPVFAHPVERELAHVFDAHGIRWRYEPHTFVLGRNRRGQVTKAFTPDFYLPDLDFYVECTVARRPLTRVKRRKAEAARRLYGIMVERGLRTALVCRDAFGKLIATGLAVVFTLQVFVVIGGVTKLIPLTGLTTPFLSYGGSSLVANWAIIALILRVSDQVRRPLPELSSSGPDHGDDATQVVKL